MSDGLDRFGAASWIPEEVWLFARIGAYAFFIAVVYWFVSYEVAGTVLLLGFGFGSLLAAGLLVFRAHLRRSTPPPAAATSASLPDGPFGDERGRVPSPAVAPLGVGLGVATASLGVAFGPWLVIVGAGLAVVASLAWLRAAIREGWATEAEER